MGYLLDTHTFIWFLNGDKQLSQVARKSIESNSANFISMASLWEMSVKVSLGKLEIKLSFEDIANHINTNGFQILPITFSDTLILASLPFHHRDPFDRMLVAQSIHNSLTIISKDDEFKNYNIKLIW